MKSLFIVEEPIYRDVVSSYFYATLSKAVV